MNFYTNVVLHNNKIKARYVIQEDRSKISEEYNPTLYVPSSSPEKYKNLDGNDLKSVSFKTTNDAREFLKGRDEVYGCMNFPFNWISENYPLDIEFDFNSLTIFNIDIEIDVDKGFPDPEKAERPINIVTIEHNGFFYSWGTGLYNGTRKDVKYTECQTEKQLLSSIICFWVDNYPDIITGYNVKFFDIPYLINRINKIFGSKKANILSPWNYIRSKTAQRFVGTKEQHYSILGISILDYLDLYKEFRKVTRESYKLDFIGHVELGMKKLSFDEVQHGFQIYKHDFSKAVEYNIRDVEIVKKLDEKFKYLSLAVTVAYESKINFEDIFSPIKMWESLITNFLQKRGILIKSKKEQFEKTETIVGGYVKPPKLGFSEWIVTFDLVSLYPSIIRALNIGPETLVETNDGGIDKFLPELSKIVKTIEPDNILNDDFSKKVNLELLKYELTLAGNGMLYCHKDISFMSELVTEKFKKRISVKREMKRLKKLPEHTQEIKNQISSLDASQHSKKIMLNSLYGAMGSPYFQFFDNRNAEAVTKTGQTIIRWIEKDLNKYFNDLFEVEVGAKDYVIAIDTDSVMLNLSSIVDIICKDAPKDKKIDFLNDLAEKKIKPRIAWCIQQLANKINIGVGNNCLLMDREVIADKGFWTAKKKYALNIYDNEGVRFKQPEMKIMGIESVRSSTPEICRDKIKEALKIILRKNNKELIEFIKEFKEEFFKMEPHEIAFPRTVNGLYKYEDSQSIYRKGTPIQTRASLLYNHYLKKKGLEDDYLLIHEGDKIKFVFLKIPNKFRENVISMVDFLPKEFELKEYIDYETQFQKAFLDPIESITDKIDWKTKKMATLSF